MNKPKLDWVADPDWKARILHAWTEYEQEPTESRLNYYWHLIYEVPIEDEEPVRLHCEHFEPVSLDDVW